MQFADGNRIDLTVADIKNYEQYCFGDGLAHPFKSVLGITKLFFGSVPLQITVALFTG